MNPSDFLTALLAVSALALAILAEPVSIEATAARKTGNDCVIAFTVPEPARTYPPTLRFGPMFARCADTALGMAWRES